MYSTFWLAYGAGLIALSPAWRDRPDPPLTEDHDDWPDLGDMAQ